MEGSVTAALLEEYSMSRSEAVRNEIVLKNLGLVRSCALSLRNTYIKYGEVGDVVNEGVIALMDAIETYDPSRGAKFETYASLKIRGAIIDYVRKQDWVPRPVRKFARDLDNANTILYNQYEGSDDRRACRVPPDKRGKAAARHGGRFKYRYALI